MPSINCFHAVNYSHDFILWHVYVSMDHSIKLVTLTHFSPVSHFYTPWKHQKTFDFLTFSGGIEMWRRLTTSHVLRAFETK